LHAIENQGNLDALISGQPDPETGWLLFGVQWNPDGV